MTSPTVPDAFSVESYVESLRSSTDNGGLYARALGNITGIAAYGSKGADDRIKDILNVIAAVDQVETERRQAATGLDYSREPDEADDPKPVSPARGGQPHVVAMTNGGLVDETPRELATVYFSFGHGQTDPITGEHLLDKYVTVIGPSYDACREAMFASKYGERWAFDYLPDTPQADEWIPQWTEHERIVLPVSGAR